MHPACNSPVTHRWDPQIREFLLQSADNATVDEEADDRFTELARTRLADTLSEAARMLSSPDAGESAGDRAGRRGFDDFLLGRPGPVRLAPPPPGTGPESSALDAKAEGLRNEVEGLREEIGDLRGEIERLETDIRTTIGQLTEATPPPAEQARVRPVVSLLDPALIAALPAPEASPPAQAPVPPSVSAPDDGYTWAFTETPRRRFWRRR